LPKFGENRKSLSVKCGPPAFVGSCLFAKTTSAFTTSTSKISAEQWPDHIQLSHLEPLFVCQVCGHKGADVRPLFDRERMPEASRRLLRGRILDELAESYPAFARSMVEAA
jgi:hypothetical protein